MNNLDSILRRRGITLSTKVHLVKAMVFPVVMYGCELDYKESLVPKNWCFWTVVLEKTLERPLDCKEIQPVHPQGDQSWVFIGRTDAEAETPVLWPPDVKSWLTGKDPDAGKDWGQEEKGTTEDEMVGWHYQLYGHGFGWTLGVGDGQGGLACCGSWGRKELDTTERSNWIELLSLFSLSSQVKTRINSICFHFILCAINAGRCCWAVACLNGKWLLGTATQGEWTHKVRVMSSRHLKSMHWKGLPSNRGEWIAL